MTKIKCICGKCELHLNDRKIYYSLFCGCEDCRQAAKWGERKGGKSPEKLQKLIYMRSDISKVKGKIFGSFLNGTEMKIENFPKKFHLVMGNESNGISDEVKSLITDKLTIKNIGKNADSLNVASATSILLYEMTA